MNLADNWLTPFVKVLFNYLYAVSIAEAPRSESLPFLKPMFGATKFYSG